MNNIEIEKMAKMENDYWWHIGKKHLVNSLIEHYYDDPNDLNILEVGCGTGNLTQSLQKYGNVKGFDISPHAVEYCRNKGLENIHLQDISVLDHTPYSNQFDLILALDVLEHIQDDLNVMQKVREMLNPDGLFFINVPAHKFLWSEHDEALEHKRRYHSVELKKKLIDSGFEIVSKSYFVSITSPGIILYRFWNNIFGRSAYPKTSYVILPDYMNDLMVKTLILETKILLKTGLPFGVTLNIIAKKIK
ncbi:class I SAM-dependent methyltransferase [candidate division WWE3 bacterium]|jgi:SAM-dependent methyltransferase|uniref:Class I SAM-dependent methyltransferase n=1 Tax=candidate division WWE3 bacterium TaxID=2053526 RepID=A0A3A4ZBB3_UNCKA|nr:MAG: class I SAM-dependent methyltransferase [candidate division WWE3 bacterium]